MRRTATIQARSSRPMWCERATWTTHSTRTSPRWSVGGGAQPPLVQEMFIHLTMRDGCCAVGFRGAPRAVNYQDAHDHVKEHAEAMDGEGRWQVEPPPLPA